METIFNWLFSLSEEHKLWLFSSLCLILVLTPYFSILYSFIKKIICWRKLKIYHFNYSFSKFDEKKFSTNQNFAINNDEFIVEGSKIFLFWKVKGALWIKLVPHIGKVKGNAAELIITRNNRKLILEAKGIFSKKQIEIEIPIHKIKTLETKVLSKTQVKSEIKNKYSFNSKYYRTRIFSINYLNYITSNINLKFNRNHISSSVSLNSFTKSNLYFDKQKIVTSFTFSTKKYNSINQTKPTNYTKNE